MPSYPLLAPSRRLGRTDLTVSPLCLGGNVFGWTADPDQSVSVLDEYAALGGNVIDTADVYSEWAPGNSGGESERIIGRWMAERRNRADIIIATKVAKLSTARGLAPATIRAAADASLARLQTDYIDIYYAHMDDPSVPMEETLGAFDELVRAGKVRYLAASNFTPDRLRLALEVSAREGLAPYVATQDHYNLMERAAYEADIQPLIDEYGLGSLPFYALARGFLTGKYRPGTTIDSPRAGAAKSYAGAKGDRVLAALAAIAEDHGCAIPAVALAWMLGRPGLTAPIASARTAAQLAEIAPMSTLALDANERAALDIASA